MCTIILTTEERHCRIVRSQKLISRKKKKIFNFYPFSASASPTRTPSAPSNLQTRESSHSANSSVSGSDNSSSRPQPASTRKWVPPSALRREEQPSTSGSGRHRTPPQSSRNSSSQHQHYNDHLNTHDLQRPGPHATSNGNGHRGQHDFVAAHNDAIFRKVRTRWKNEKFPLLSLCDPVSKLCYFLHTTTFLFSQKF